MTKQIASIMFQVVVKLQRRCSDIMKKANANPAQKAFQLSLISEADYKKQLQTIEEEKRKKRRRKEKARRRTTKEKEQQEWFNKVKEWIPSLW